MNVAGYLRVSTTEQGESGAGIEAQKQAIEAACKQRGFELDDFYRDIGVSGSTPFAQRPAGALALDALAKRKHRALIIAKLDRLSRSAFDFAGIMRLSLVEDWAIIALDIGVDTTTPSGKMIAQVMSAFAEFELDMIRQRTRDGLAAKRAMGVRLGRPNDVSEATAEHIVRLHADGMNYSQIARELEQTEIPTPRGGRRWYVSTVSEIVRRAINA